jgi:hypothetical protein
MPDTAALELVASRLRAIFERHATGLQRSTAIKGVDGWSAPYLGRDGKPMWVGGVRIGKQYVSYYLMPVYGFPGLLAGISPELERRRQGKSCFNFTQIDEPLFAELEALTQRGLERMLAERPFELLTKKPGRKG